MAAADRVATENAREGDRMAANITPMAWPVDAKGDPMVEIAFQAHELIGLQQFSNITVGPATIRTLVSMNEANPFTERQLANIAKALGQLAETVEVDVIAEQRQIALNTIDPSKRHDSG